MRAPESPFERYTSKRILFFAFLMCSSGSETAQYGLEIIFEVLQKNCFSRLHPQTQSTGFSDNWANQRSESLLPLASWWNLRAQSSINPRVLHCAQSEEKFLAARSFSWSWWSKMGKTTKRTTARKQPKAARCEKQVSKRKRASIKWTDKL